MSLKFVKLMIYRYAIVRVGGIQEKGTLKTTIRDIFICWVGPAVGIIEKGRKVGYLGDAQSFLQVSIVPCVHIPSLRYFSSSHPYDHFIFCDLRD
jgi:hypothetical protein